MFLVAVVFAVVSSELDAAGISVVGAQSWKSLQVLTSSSTARPSEDRDAAPAKPVESIASSEKVIESGSGA
jgi:hypothetical protein